jgi:hypothetical protein
MVGGMELGCLAVGWFAGAHGVFMVGVSIDGGGRERIESRKVI